MREYAEIRADQLDAIRHMGYCVWYMGIIVALMGLCLFRQFVEHCRKEWKKSRVK